MSTSQQRVRNFCIIAHIDHGKSTLADRLLEFTGSISARDMQDQVLDTMDLERERGITIKLQAVRMTYPARDRESYELNLIDTPGHVDFAYEVSRSLAACEGAILVVDAAQGIEAQTLANLYQAVEAGLTIVPVVNKIDLAAAQPELVAEEISDVTGIAREDVIFASAKQGIGTQDILEAVIARVPPPRGNLEAPLRALIFDSHYDPYRGVITYVRVVDGEIKARTRARMMNTGKVHEVDEVGVVRSASSSRREAECRRGRICHRGHQERDRRSRRRHHHHRRRWRLGAAAWLSPGQADGVRRAVSNRLRPVRGP